jgi:hypothetical protein
MDNAYDVVQALSVPCNVEIEYGIFGYRLIDQNGDTVLGKIDCASLKSAEPAFAPERDQQSVRWLTKSSPSFG